METVETLVGKVQQRVGMTPGYDLVVDWLDRAIQDDLVPRRDWSWRRKHAQFIYNAPYTTGTITIERGNSHGTCSGSTLTQAMVGRQLRVNGNATVIRTITRIDGSRIEFLPAWGESSVSGVTFRIYNVYQTVPEDFDSFITIVDLARSFQLNWWELTSEDLDALDPQRSHGGSMAYYMVLRDYSTSVQGVVGSVVQSKGSGNKPVSGGSYSGVADSIITIEMTSGSAFNWKKDNGTATAAAVDSEGQAQELTEGVTISFPSSVAYTNGDVFTIHLRAALGAGRPRYEAWPHIEADEVRPYLYNCRPLALTDPGAVIPHYIKTGWLLEKALAACARWKHPENKYYDLKLAIIHDTRAEQYFLDMEREDQNREVTDVRYDSWRNLPTDSGYLAGRDVGYEIDVLDY